MKRLFRNFTTAAAASLVLMGAQASPITAAFDITATDFILTYGDGSVAPIQPFVLDFSITFDNAADIYRSTSGLAVSSFNLPYAVEYSYNAALDAFIVATSSFTLGCDNPANTFCVFIRDISSLAPRADFVEQSTSTGAYWSAQTIDAVFDGNRVPEPATATLLGLGLLGMGLARRRH